MITRLRRLTGYPKEDFDTRRRKWSELILEEDLPGAKTQIHEALKTVPAPMRGNTASAKSPERLSGCRFRARSFTMPTGKIDYISGVIFDITERKRAEEALHKYEFIANTAKDCMTLIDRNYIYEAANAAYCQAHGKTREEVVGTGRGQHLGARYL